MNDPASDAVVLIFWFVFAAVALLLLAMGVGHLLNRRGRDVPGIYEDEWDSTWGSPK